MISFLVFLFPLIYGTGMEEELHRSKIGQKKKKRMVAACVENKNKGCKKKVWYKRGKTEKGGLIGEDRGREADCC